MRDQPSSQLRIYGIEPGRLDDFVSAWTAGVLPLRRRFGFEVTAWTVPGGDTFVWMLSYAGPGTFAEADALYYASPERADLRPDPAEWIVTNETRWLQPIDR
jgi:hypothetical protein